MQRNKVAHVFGLDRTVSDGEGVDEPVQLPGVIRGFLRLLGRRNTGQVDTGNVRRSGQFGHVDAGKIRGFVFDRLKFGRADRHYFPCSLMR